MGIPYLYVNYYTAILESTVVVAIFRKINVVVVVCVAVVVNDSNVVVFVANHKANFKQTIDNFWGRSGWVLILLLPLNII